MAGTGTGTHLDEHMGPVGVAHDQIDLAAATSGRPIIARDEAKAGTLQVLQRAVFRGITRLFAGWCPHTHILPEPGIAH